MKSRGRIWTEMRACRHSECLNYAGVPVLLRRGVCQSLGSNSCVGGARVRVRVCVAILRFLALYSDLGLSPDNLQ